MIDDREKAKRRPKFLPDKLLIADIVTDPSHPLMEFQELLRKVCS